MEVQHKQHEAKASDMYRKYMKWVDLSSVWNGFIIIFVSQSPSRQTHSRQRQTHNEQPLRAEEEPPSDRGEQTDREAGGVD